MRTAIFCCIFVVLIQLISGQEDLFAICDAKSGDIEMGFTMIQTQGQSQVQILGYVFGIPGEVGEYKLHGFHIHENPCTPDDCQACGGHYNPFGNNHGGPNDEDRHVGDLGNIVTGSGEVDVDIRDSLVTLEGENSVIGRSMVVHAGEDDLGTSGDPSGNSGQRIICCTIESIKKK